MVVAEWVSCVASVHVVLGSAPTVWVITQVETFMIAPAPSETVGAEAVSVAWVSEYVAPNVRVPTARFFAAGMRIVLVSVVAAGTFASAVAAGRQATASRAPSRRE